jgi:hypothetical protein
MVRPERFEVPTFSFVAQFWCSRHTEQYREQQDNNRKPVSVVP